MIFFSINNISEWTFRDWYDPGFLVSLTAYLLNAKHAIYFPLIEFLSVLWVDMVSCNRYFLEWEEEKYPGKAAFLMTTVFTQACHCMCSLDVLLSKGIQKIAEWVNQLQFCGCNLEEISAEHFVGDVCVRLPVDERERKLGRNFNVIILYLLLGTTRNSK